MLLLGVGLTFLVAVVPIARGFQPTNLPAARVTPQVTGGPSVAIDRTVFEYGDVKIDTPIETNILLRNVGDQDLVFIGEPSIEVLEGCCPPKAVLNVTTLMPGEETTVIVRFTRHAGMDGLFDFRVRIRTNDPVYPEQEVAIRSNWLP